MTKPRNPFHRAKAENRFLNLFRWRNHRYSAANVQPVIRLMFATGEATTGVGLGGAHLHAPRRIISLDPSIPMSQSDPGCRECQKGVSNINLVIECQLISWHSSDTPVFPGCFEDSYLDIVRANPAATGYVLVQSEDKRFFRFNTPTLKH